MATTIGGTSVASGYYWNLGRWEVIPVARDGETLPGGRGDKYMKVPVLAAFLLLPLMGGLFVVFLPFIGFVLAAHAGAKMLAGLFHRSAAELASTVAPGWRPGEAHLTGKRADEEKPEPPAADDRLEALEKEIESKRRG